MLNFIGGLTEKERKETKLVSLLNVPPSVLSYCKNWSYFIAEYASDRYKMQVSCSDLTVQHLAEYFAHRGGKGNLGKVLTDEVRAKISEAMTGKKHTAESIAARTGMKRTAETCAKISEANTGRKHTAKSIAKMSEAMTGRKRSAETIAKMREAKTGRECTAETRAKISETMRNKKRK